MNEHRDRASGWKHAKLSGHQNEELACNLLKTDLPTQQRLKAATKVDQHDQLVDCDYGGLCETDIASVMGGKKLGVSVKKSLGGQVYLIKDETFIRGMEKQYNITIPEDVKRAIQLFWGSATDVIEIINKYSTDPTVKVYELRKHRITAQTLKNYDRTLYDSLLQWFQNNIYNITDFCFGRGLALETRDHASVVWYKNLLGEHDVDAMYNIAELCRDAEQHKDMITYGTRNGGTVINLPFGFVQWHQDSMQFHHKQATIAKLVA